MKNQIKAPAYLAGAFSLLLGCNVSTPTEDASPNFIIIYCDDLGYGDLGCFGAEDIRTPNIDRLAGDGIRFTEFYSASPVCSPSRAALMTGRIPQRMGINGVFFPDSYTGMPPGEITIPELLKTAGYACGMVGKWHLGHREKFLPLQQGFDEYFGIPYSNDMQSVVYLDGNEVAEFNPDQHYTTRTYTEKAVDYIDRHKDEKFFLYLAHNMPHVPIFASEAFEGSSERGLYGDVIQEIDWSVGQVLQKLEEEGILENTLVIFSSDNGPWLVMRDHGGSAGMLREGKQYTFEGGQRVPALAMWPAEIEAGRVYDDMGLMMDWLPTLCEIAGVEIPADRDYDGESILKVLKGEGKRVGDEFLYYDGAKLECYRKGDWKIKLPYEGFAGANWKHTVAAHPLLLVNLEDDPGEQHNLAEANPEKVEEMLVAMEKYKESKGDLPPSLVIRTNQVNNYTEHLLEKYGEEYYNIK